MLLPILKQGIVTKGLVEQRFDQRYPTVGSFRINPLASSLARSRRTLAADAPRSAISPIERQASLPPQLSQDLIFPGFCLIGTSLLPRGPKTHRKTKDLANSDYRTSRLPRRA